MISIEICEKNLLERVTLGDLVTIYKLSQMDGLTAEMKRQLRDMYADMCSLINLSVVCSDEYADPDAYIENDGTLTIYTSYSENCIDVPIIQKDVDDFIEDDVYYEGEYEGVFGPESYNLSLMDIIKQYNDELESNMQSDYEDAVDNEAMYYSD